MKSLKSNATGKLLESTIKTAQSIADTYCGEVFNRKEVVGDDDFSLHYKLWPIIALGNPVEMYVEFLPENGNIAVLVQYANARVASRQIVDPKDLLKTTTQLILEFRARGVNHPAPTCKGVDLENQPTIASTDFYTSQGLAEDGLKLAGEMSDPIGKYTTDINSYIAGLGGVTASQLSLILQHLADNNPDLSEYLNPLLRPVVPITFTAPIPITGKESVCLNGACNDKVEISTSRKLVPTKTTTTDKSFPGGNG